MKRLVVPFLLLAACGQHERTPTGAAGNVTDSVFPPTPDTAWVWDPSGQQLGLGTVQWGDLDSLVARRRIRALVPYSRSYYHMDGKDRSGLAYEALDLFEKDLDRQLGLGPVAVRVVFIPVPHERLIPLLAQGYGDLAFGGITITDERLAAVDFSTPTLTGLSEVVVSGPGASDLHALNDLAGQEVHVHAGSSYEESLHTLNKELEQQGAEPVRIVPVDRYLSTEDILELVNAGLVPCTVVEDRLADQWAEVLDSLTVHHELVLRTEVSFACAIRKDAPRLTEAVNDFLRRHGKGRELGNVLYHRYLVSEGRLHHARTDQTLDRLAEVRPLFHRYAAMYDLDPLLLLAQAYQESHLDQGRHSSAGAVGIMQIKPSTAAGPPIHIPDVHDLEQNIHAGTKYMRYVMDEFLSDVEDPLQRHLLALASYNAGPTRIAHLRRRASEHGLDPDQWFGEVEQVVAHAVGRETVTYVSNIYKFYTSYTALEEYAERSGGPIL